MQNNESRHRPFIFHKNELKMGYKLRGKNKTIKPLESNTEENSGDLGVPMSF